LNSKFHRQRREVTPIFEALDAPLSSRLRRAGGGRFRDVAGCPNTGWSLRDDYAYQRFGGAGQAHHGYDLHSLCSPSYCALSAAARAPKQSFIGLERTRSQRARTDGIGPLLSSQRKSFGSDRAAVHPRAKGRELVMAWVKAELDNASSDRGAHPRHVCRAPMSIDLNSGSPLIAIDQWQARSRPT
jgi:hypothetical protein